jgi:integrase
MAQTLNKLRAQSVKTLPVGKHGDGGGLWLVVTERQRSFVFIYIRDKRRREMGLGSALTVGLAQARELAEAARQQLAAGIDPLEARRAAKPRSNVPTFGEMAEDVIKAKAAGWKDPRHPDQWRKTLSLVTDRKGKPAGHCQSLVNIQVNAVTVDHVLAVLRPIWRPCGGKGKAGIVTASRIRERIELILAAAETAGHRPAGKNPATWRGHLEHLLPKVRHRKRHHDAMPYADVPAYVATLRTAKGIRARALEFTILTAVRTTETRGAAWREIDLQARMWAIPAARMKADRDHRVPLSARAVAILEDVAKLRPAGCNGSTPVFPGARDGKALAPGMMLKLLNLTHPDLTVHGFRASFRTWAGDAGRHAREVIEFALAHVVGDEAERAYARSDLLERRRVLMAEWAAFVAGEPAKAAARPVRLLLRRRRLPLLRPALEPAAA